MSEEKFDNNMKEAFLIILREVPVLTVAARAVGIATCTVRDHRTKYPEFDAAVKEAMEEGVDSLEAEAVRRARDGWKEPVYYKGERVGNVRKYSDYLLGVLLKGRRAKVYNPGATVEAGSGDNKVTMKFNFGG